MPVRGFLTQLPGEFWQGLVVTHSKLKEQAFASLEKKIEDKTRQTKRGKPGENDMCFRQFIVSQVHLVQMACQIPPV